MMTKLGATIISIKMPLKLPQHRERSVGSSSGQVTYILFGLNGGSDFTAGRDMLLPLPQFARLKLKDHG